MRSLRRAANNDPAPSRLNYRLQRWLLTPGVRLFLRAGVPFAVVFGAVSLYMSDETRRDNFNIAVDGLIRSVQERPEFMVNMMAIDGAGRSVSQDIREVVPLDFPISSFDLDLTEIRETVVGLDPVRDASVRIRPGGVLQIDVTERVPVLVWRTRDAVELLDETGAHVGFVDARSERPDLPLVAGEGASDHVPEALAVLAAAAPLRERVRGMVRVGARRWDVVLDREQVILLPEKNPVQALERVLTLSDAYEMLDRDVVQVDMRLGQRPTLRMSQAALESWWQIKQLTTGEQ